MKTSAIKTSNKNVSTVAANNKTACQFISNNVGVGRNAPAISGGYELVVADNKEAGTATTVLKKLAPQAASLAAAAAPFGDSVTSIADNRNTFNEYHQDSITGMLGDQRNKS